MSDEISYKIVVSKITKGIKEQRSWEKIYDENHPKVLEKPDICQYDYVNVVKSFTDTDIILEQRLESIDLQKILRAINYKQKELVK